MEEDQEEPKFCEQSFRSWTSMGVHMELNSAETDENINSRKLGFEVGEHSGYTLRENPKKSCRFSDAKNGDGGDSRKENKCIVCGKRFQTLRALSGHMRHHSPKERKINRCNECGKGFETMKGLFGHMKCHSGNCRVVHTNQSEDEAASFKQRKRPRTKRYKIDANTFVSYSSSLNVTESDPEVIEVAMSLILLSRGWSQIGSIGECSFDVVYLNEDKAITENEGLVNNGDQGLEFSIPEEMKLDNENVANNLDSGIVSNEEKKVELEGGGDEFMENKSGTVVSDSEMVKEVLDEAKFEHSEAELVKDLGHGGGSDQTSSESGKPNSSKKVRVGDDCVPELGGNSSIGMKGDSDCKVLDEMCKKGEYKCKTCKKVFSTHQALGGHRARHNREAKSSCLSRPESSQKGYITGPISDTEIDGKLAIAKLELADNSVEQEGVTIETSFELKKNKLHECPICFKSYATGQSLGGHKRAHFAGNSGLMKRVTVEQEHSDVDDVVNRATLREDANVDVGFKPWWVGSDRKHAQQLVGLVSN